MLNPKCLYIAGGQQRVTSDPSTKWGSFGAALLLRMSLNDASSTRLLEYVTPLEMRAGELGDVIFKSGTLAGDTLYVCTPTEVMAFRGASFTRTLHLSLPCFNDVHHVSPTPDGNLLIVCTGLDMVVEATPAGKIVRHWGVLGKSPWERFSQQADYRMVPTTQPHSSHPNFVFQTGEDVWVTRMIQRDCVCLTNPAKRIDIAVQGPHDGFVRGDLVYFTTVDGHVVTANHRTLRIEHIAKLRPLEGTGESELGWCRGILPLNESLAWVGFSRLRPTKFKEYISWVKHGFQTFHRPSRLALYDLNKGECLKEVSVERYGLNSVFSIFDGASFEQAQAPEAVVEHDPELAMRCSA
jgi:hypothetical protein